MLWGRTYSGKVRKGFLEKVIFARGKSRNRTGWTNEQLIPSQNVRAFWGGWREVAITWFCYV